MENFTNETLDTTRLPKFEEVQFTFLHPNYWKVQLINIVLIWLIIGVAIGVGLINIEEWQPYQMQIIIAALVIALFSVFIVRIAFSKKGFAFRTHDVLFRRGIIATNTIVIPYNRVQHVSLHEGLLSRYFGLAKIEIFTAGGSSSDIEIPGIEKGQAENIKQLLMGKIQKQL